MINKFKPISISLSPNVQKDDVKLALGLLFNPFRWKKGKAIKQLEDSFKKYLGVKYAFSFNSGRSSFFAILKTLSEANYLKKGDSVLLQAFTCNAVPNPILWANLNPIYIDCNDNFNINVDDDLKSKILNHKSKVLVVQHTFGLPANMDEIVKIANENNLILIEDCAHALGAEYTSQSAFANSSGPLRQSSSETSETKKVGTMGKASFFSFSRDKVISSVYGGMAVTNDDEMGKKLEKLQKEFGMPSNLWILQQLRHPILLNYLILPLYNFLDLGKIFLVFSQWTHFLSKAVSWKEKRGLKPDYFPKALPNALAIMAQNQFNKLDSFYNHRKKIAEFYYKELQNTSFKMPDMINKQSYLRFPIQHKNAHEIIYEAWNNQNILIGDWYTSPIAPDDTKIGEMRYKLGSCKNAERLAKITLNLPTHINISMDDAKRIINFLKKWKYA